NTVCRTCRCPAFPSRDCVPLALLSFPTRRSSDLVHVQGHQCQYHYPLRGYHAQAREAGGQGTGGRVSQCRNQYPQSGPGVCHWQDRKSTRLNSSHVKISYAVFCLKKKTKANTNKA